MVGEASPDLSAGAHRLTLGQQCSYKSIRGAEAAPAY